MYGYEGLDVLGLGSGDEIVVQVQFVQYYWLGDVGVVGYVVYEQVIDVYVQYGEGIGY